MGGGFQVAGGRRARAPRLPGREARSLGPRIVTGNGYSPSQSAGDWLRRPTTPHKNDETVGARYAEPCRTHVGNADPIRKPAAPSADGGRPRATTGKQAKRAAQLSGRPRGARNKTTVLVEGLMGQYAQQVAGVTPPSVRVRSCDFSVAGATAKRGSRWASRLGSTHEAPQQALQELSH